jgi:hypothetical protein
MTYTYSVVLSLERGSHELSVQVNNVWQIVSSSPQNFVVSYDLTVHGVDLYQGDAKLDAWNIQLADVILPSLPMLSFDCADELAGQVTAVIRERGLKIYQFIVTHVQKGNGTFTHQCDAAEADILSEQKDWLVPAGTAGNVLSSLLPTLHLVGGAYLAGDVQRQQMNNATLLDIVNQLLIANMCIGHVRNGTLFINSLDVDTDTAIYALSKDDPQTSFQSAVKTYGKVRTHYAHTMYPVPGSAITEYDAGNWTGTIADVSTTTAEGLLSKSGADYFLKATGAVSRASLLTSFNDFDRFHLNWKPDAATSLVIKLETSGGNDLSYTRTFAGGQGEGFTVYGATPDAEVVYDIVANKRIVYVDMRMNVPCAGKATLLDAGSATLYATDWVTSAGQDNILRIDLPSSTYTAYASVTLRLTFKGLAVIGAQYGIQCTQLEIYEYAASTEWIPYETPNDKIVSRLTLQATPQILGITGMTPYVKWYLLDFGAVPAVGATEEVRIAAFQSTVYVKGTYWDGPTTHDLIKNFAINPSVAIENGRIIGRFQISWYNAFNACGDLYMYEWSYGHTFTLSVWVVDVAAGAAGYWGNTVWTVVKWARGTSYYGWDEIDLPLSAFTKTGNPTNLVKVTLTAATINYYDTCYLYASVPIPKIAEAGNGQPMYDVRGITFGSFSSALAYAQGMLALVSTPANEYTKDVGLTDDMDIGSVVLCDGENSVIYSLAYTQEMKTIKVGRQVGGIVAALQGLSRRIDAVEKIIL